MTVLEILTKARELIATPERFAHGLLFAGPNGEVCRDSDAVRFSLDGALMKASGNPSPYAAYSALGFKDEDDLWPFEDNATHAEVLARLDTAIAAEEAKVTP